MKVLLQLQKQQFDKGMRDVQTSISNLGRTVKSVAGMIVGGLGLASLVNQFKDTATQLSIVKNTLENVSNGFKEYSENMEFIKRISKDYGQDMLALTNGYAKFTAAAKTSNLSLEQQRTIFEALTRAAGAYHMSADQTSNVMLAVEQMISKGKVTMEELRRQLGNNLPGAFNRMAEAWAMAQNKAQVSTAELETAMRAGKVLADEVLPHFAQVLNATTEAANFDSLQSSLNRFRNAWVDFVDHSGFEKVFKGLVDIGTKSLDNLSSKSISFARLVATTVGAVIGYNLPKAWVKLKEEGQRNLSPTTKYILKLNDNLEKTESQITRTAKQLELLQGGKVKGKKIVVGGITREDMKLIDDLSKKEKGILRDLTKQGEMASWKMERTEAETFLIAKKNRLEKEYLDLQKESTVFSKAQKKEAQSVVPVLEGAKSTLKAVGSAIAGIAVNMAAAFAVTLIINWIAKLIEAGKEMRRFKNLTEESEESIKNATAETEKQISSAKELLKIAQDTEKSDEMRNAAADKFKKLLGDQKLTIDEIKTGSDNVTSSLDNWEKSIRRAAMQAAIFSRIEKLSTEMVDKQVELEKEKAKPQTERLGGTLGMTSFMGVGKEVPTKAAQNVERLTREIAALDAEIERYHDIAKKEGYINPFENASDTDKAKAIQDILDGYSQSVAALDERLKRSDISSKKHDRDLNKLSTDTMNSIQKYEGWEDIVESLGKEYEKLIEKIKQTAGGGSGKKTPIEQLKEDLDDFIKEKNALDNTLQAGKMTGEEYADAMEKLVNKFRDNIYGMDDLQGKLKILGQKYIDAVKVFDQAFSDVKMFDDIDKQTAQWDKEFEQIVSSLEKNDKKLQDAWEKINDIIFGDKAERRKKEPGIFAYKDGLHNTLNGMARDAEGVLRDLEKQERDLREALSEVGEDALPYMLAALDELNEKLKIARNEFTGLRTAADFAEATADIEALKKALREEGWSAWSDGIVGGAQNIVSAMQTLDELADGGLFDEEFLEGVSKVLQVFEALNSIVETINNSFKLFNSIIKTTTQLEEAQAAQAAAMGQAKSSALAAETVAEQVSAAATQGAEATKKAAIESTTSALAKQAIVGGAASQSALPVVGPALAAAAVAMLTGLLVSSMQKFAGGGFVKGGSRTGDHTLIRANQGELVLNAGQQRNLWDILNGKGGMGGKVEFELRGDRLLGAINNYQSKRRG